MVEEPPEGRRTDRRSYLKKLAFGLIGATALLSLGDVPKASAANAYLTLGDNKANNSNPNSTGMSSSTTGTDGTLYVENTGSSGIAVQAAVTSATGKPVVAKGASGQTANLQEWQNNAGAALSVIDKSGWLGIGTSTPAALIHVTRDAPNPVVVEGNGSVGVSVMFDNYYGSGGALAGGGFLGRMARGSKASPANVSVGDRLGFNVFGGYAGGAFRHVAAIEALVDSGTVSATSLPSAIRFLTAPNGSIARQERMRITNAGNVGIGTTMPQQKLYVAGDAGQTASANGFLKAAVVVNGTAASIVRSFNNLPSGAAPTVSRPSGFGPGTYEVNLGVDVSQRYFLAALISSNQSIAGGASDGQILVSPRDGNPNAVFVRTNDSTGTNTDRSFYLLIC